MRARRLDGWRLAAVVLAAVLVLRAVGLVFGVVDNDETDFLLVGRVIRAGGWPYVDAFDHKPPLLYLLFAPSAWLTWQVWPMQLVGVGFLTATGLVVARTATLWSGSRAAGAAAALGCVLASAANVVSVNAELLMNLPASVALLCFVRAGDARRQLVWCGVAIGLASLIKHQAGILLVALALAELRAPRRLTLLALGCALPWLAAAGLYAAHGQLAAFYEWNVTRNLHYAGHSVGSPLARFAVGLIAYGLGAAPLSWLLAWRRSRALSRAARIRVGLVAALWLTFIPISLGGRFYNHYYLQLVPPLCVLAAAPAAALWRMRGRLRPWQRRWALVALLAPVAVAQAIHLGRGLAGQYPSQEPRTRALADWLRAHTGKGERVVVYGHYTPIYQQAERLPGTRYIDASPLFGNVDAMQLDADGDGNGGADAARLRSPADEAAFLDDVTAARWFVDTAPADIKHWSRLPLAAQPRLAAYVAAHFTPLASPGGAVVYRRVAP